MGLFSWMLKKRKKEEPRVEERHFIDDVKKDKPIRKTENKTKAEAPIIKNEEPEAASVCAPAAVPEIKEECDVEEVKVKGFGGAFDIKRSKDGRYVFNLYAANRVIVATSQIYSSSQSALTGIKSVIANAERAGVEDQTLKQYQPLPYPKWEIYVDKGGQYRWRLLATNGSCILHSQGYTQKSTCKKGIESVIRTAKNAQIDKSYLEKG